MVYIAVNSLTVHCISHIRVHCDNSRTVHCINRKGSAKSPMLNGWILSLKLLLRKRGWHLLAFHIVEVTNVIADTLSRDKVINSEWTLNVQSFKWMCSLAPMPQIDLFAKRENHLLLTYCSPVLDHQAVAMGAFLVDWSRWSCLYLIPLTPTILKALGKMAAFKGRAYVVTPALSGESQISFST